MKVGFFDSGLGGITIFNEALKKINVDYMYLADNKNAPYGIKDKDEVKKYIFENVEFLIENGCDIIIVACNTATSIAIDNLRVKYPNICIIGTEPAIKIAVDNNKVKRILVCATTITKNGEKLKKLIENLNAKDIVDVISLDKLVEFAEDENVELLSNINYEEVELYLKERLMNYNFLNYSHVVLGCTHFPLFKKEFEKIIDKNVSIIDSREGVVKNLENKIQSLNENIDCNKVNKEKNVQLVITKESKNFINKFKEIACLEEFEVIIK